MKESGFYYGIDIVLGVILGTTFALSIKFVLWMSENGSPWVG